MHTVPSREIAKNSIKLLEIGGCGYHNREIIGHSDTSPSISCLDILDPVKLHE